MNIPQFYQVRPIVKTINRETYGITIPKKYEIEWAYKYTTITQSGTALVIEKVSDENIVVKRQSSATDRFRKSIKEDL